MGWQRVTDEGSLPKQKYGPFILFQSDYKMVYLNIRLLYIES